MSEPEITDATHDIAIARRDIVNATRGIAIFTRDIALRAPALDGRGAPVLDADRRINLRRAGLWTRSAALSFVMLAKSRHYRQTLLDFGIFAG